MLDLLKTMERRQDVGICPGSCYFLKSTSFPSKFTSRGGLDPIPNTCHPIIDLLLVKSPLLKSQINSLMESTLIYLTATFIIINQSRKKTFVQKLEEFVKKKKRVITSIYPNLHQYNNKTINNTKSYQYQTFYKCYQ